MKSPAGARVSRVSDEPGYHIYTTQNLLIFILEKLPADKFMQVHKSYIVNEKMINTIEGNMLHLGNHKITMGLSFTEEVMARVLKDRFIKR